MGAHNFQKGKCLIMMKSQKVVAREIRYLKAMELCLISFWKLNTNDNSYFLLSYVKKKKRKKKLLEIKI